MSGLAKARALYSATSLREKLLALAFILVALIIWSNNWLGRLSEWNDARRLNAVELATQQQWLDRSNEFTEAMARALERVDPQKTFKYSELSGRVDELLRRTGLSTKADIDPVNTREGEIFNDHNLRIRLNRISISDLVTFNELLEQDSPYINILSVRIKSVRNQEEQLNVRYELNSFELKEGSLQ